MLALLGWNDGTEQELFSLQELVDKFSIERISKHGAKFDMEKAKWFNHQYLQNVSNRVLAEEYLKELNAKGYNTNIEFVESIVALVKERCSFAKELWDNSDYFFVRPSEYAEKALKKRWKEGTSQRMNDIIDNLSKIEDNKEWGEKAEEFLMEYIPKNELNMGQIMNSIRLAIVGDTKGVNMVEIFKLLGKQESLERMKIASEKINL